MSDWSNEKLMRFLEAYRSEPVIWDPHYKFHKDKKMVYEAWERISKTIRAPIKVLKAKKEVLMGTFRRHLKRMQDLSGSGDDEDFYKPTWFAFELMESFLMPIYTNKKLLKPKMVQTNPPNTERYRRNFSRVKRKCIELVKNGFPAEFIDDVAFQSILAMIPMPRDRREELNAKLIQKLADCDDGQSDGADKVHDYPQQYDDMEEEQDTSCLEKAVKLEMETLEECTCRQKEMDAHEIDCPVASRLLPYLNYYQLSPETGKCCVCGREVTWSEVDDLKLHLDTEHPGVRYDDYYRDREPELTSEDEGKTSIKHEKRKFDKIKQEPKEENAEFLYINDKKEDFSPPRKRFRIESTEVVLKSGESIPLDQFYMLERFGLHVAALLGNLSVDKCLKYQNDIFDNLMQAQPPAG